MPILKNNKNDQLLFIHIPKTAGTALKQNIKEDCQLIFDAEFKKELPCPPQHFHAELLERLGLNELSDGSFAVVRHPIKRFISEFSYRKKVDRKFKHLNIVSFFYFIRMIYKHDNYVLSNHLRPQSEFLFPDTKVFKIEDGLQAVFETYPDFFNSPTNEQVPRANKSDSAAISIDPQTLADLEAFYAKDLQRVDYERGAISTEPLNGMLRLFYRLQAFVLYVVFRLLK